MPDGTILRLRINEVEAYKGEDDKACHAAKGKTSRTKVMYDNGGKVYMYLIYGMYWMLNIVTETKGNPQAVLIRGVEGCVGPGRITRLMQLDKAFYGEDLVTSQRLWIEDAPMIKEFSRSERINIQYAGEPWTSVKWRWFY